MNPLKKYENKLITSRDQVYKNPAKVGQAVYDIMRVSQPTQTVEETIEAMTGKYFEKLMAAVDEGCKAKNYPDIFYVLVERKKETLMGNAQNVLATVILRPLSSLKRRWFAKKGQTLILTSMKLIAPQSEINYLWTLPTYQDS